MSSCASAKKISVGSSVSRRAASRSCSSYQSPSASAFWKIVGFEVTPTTASSSISRASSPVSSISRERESIQTLTPCSLSSCSLDVAISPRFQPSRAFPAPRPSPTVPDSAPRRRSGAPRNAATSSRGERRPDDLGAEAEHVHVVVLDALVRRVDVVADRRADPGDLAGGDRGADARAADEDAALARAPRGSPSPTLARLVRVVDAHRVGVDAEVDRLVAARRDRLEDRARAACTPRWSKPTRDLHPSDALDRGARRPRR